MLDFLKKRLTAADQGGNKACKPHGVVDCSICDRTELERQLLRSLPKDQAWKRQNSFLTYTFFAIQNGVNGKVFIGYDGVRISEPPSIEPWKRDLEFLGTGKHGNRLLQEDWSTHGHSSFNLRIMETKDLRVGGVPLQMRRQIPLDFRIGIRDESPEQAVKKWIEYFGAKHSYNKKWDQVERRQRAEEQQRHRQEQTFGVAPPDPVLVTGGAVYIITNTQTNLVYIGSSEDVETRWSNHRSQLDNRKHPNQLLQRDWTFYGPSRFKFSVLERVGSVESLSVAEQKWIDHYRKTLGLQALYNIQLSVPARQSSEG